MLGALAGAIHRSHDRIAGLVAENPEIEGTSTTVTAVIFDGTHIGVGHVGDSRGYLLRDGTLSQLTTDHTFVQSLIDEGRITEDEARVHPHRNLILRAVDGVHEPEPDVFTLEVAPGDRILLCSDGCSGVLSDEELARILGDGTPDHVAVSLIQRVARRRQLRQRHRGRRRRRRGRRGRRRRHQRGRRHRSDDRRRRGRGAPPTWHRLRSGAPAPPTPASSSPCRGVRALRRTSTPRRCATHRARRAIHVGPPARRPRAGRPAGRAIIGVRRLQWSQSQYYVANDGDDVVIFQGIEADVPGITTHHVEETSELTLDELPDYNARQVQRRHQRQQPRGRPRHRQPARAAGALCPGRHRDAVAELPRPAPSQRGLGDRPTEAHRRGPARAASPAARLRATRPPPPVHRGAMSSARASPNAPQGLMGFVHRRRRGAELVLLVLSLVVGIGAYAAVGLGVDGTLPVDLFTYGAWLAALVIGCHVVIRIFAAYADPILLPIVSALNGLGLAMIHRIDLGRQAGDSDARTFAGAQLVWMTLGVAPLRRRARRAS